MKLISQTYKNNIKELGKEIDSIITYTINNVEMELGVEQLNSVTPHYEGNILKSVMKQLDIESLVDIPIGTIVNYQFGVKVNDEEVQDYRDNYEYINFGNYIVYSSEKQEDASSYKIVCYDKMLYSMKDYESFATYPITIRSYINSLCTHLGLTFANLSDTFANYNKEIPSELYLDASGNSLEYTFRDVLDQLAQVTASTICINDDDELEIRYINNTQDTIDEEYLKDINVNFGEATKPINTITFKRSADSDVISLSTPSNLSDDLKNEIAISDNQILNGDNRADYLNDILNQLYGLTYYINDYTSTGITYYDLCDKYNVSITKRDDDGNVLETTTYSCIMFNDEIQVTQGLQENVNTDMPNESVTNYNTTTKDDRGINRTNLVVDKVNQRITSEISSIEDVRVVVLGNYVLTQDETFQSGKNYYVFRNETYELYPQYDNYEGVREGSPYDLGLFETTTSNVYELTDDTTFEEEKVYYEYDDEQETYTIYTGERTGNPNELQLYEVTEITTNYIPTSDTNFVQNKNYYVRNYIIGGTIPSNTIYELQGSITQEIKDNTTDLENKINNAQTNAVQQAKEYTNSQITQSKSEIELSFTTKYVTNDALDEATDEINDEIKKYLRFIEEDGRVELGLSTDNVELRLKNNKIYFYDKTGGGNDNLDDEENSNILAYISDKKLYIKSAKFITQIQIGDFAFTPRNNGSLSFKKVV